MFLLLAAPYMGVCGGFVRSKRILQLEEAFKNPIYKDASLEREDTQSQGLIKLHAGYTKSFHRVFMGIEAFLGKTLGQNYFKQNFNGGVKAILGMNITSKFQMYGGAGVDFVQIKSLKMLNNNNEHEMFKNSEGRSQVLLDYRMFPQFLINVGGHLLISKYIGLKIDVEYLMSGAKQFSDEEVKCSALKIVLDKNSSEKYRSLRGMLGVSYYFGGNVL